MPPQVTAGLLVWDVTAEPLVLSRVPPLSATVPVPSAPALLTFNVPVLSVVVPE